MYFNCVQIINAFQLYFNCKCVSIDTFISNATRETALPLNVFREMRFPECIQGECILHERIFFKCKSNTFKMHFGKCIRKEVHFECIWNASPSECMVRKCILNTFKMHPLRTHVPQMHLECIWNAFGGSAFSPNAF